MVAVGGVGSSLRLSGLERKFCIAALMSCREVWESQCWGVQRWKRVVWSAVAGRERGGKVCLRGENSCGRGMGSSGIGRGVGVGVGVGAGVSKVVVMEGMSARWSWRVQR